MKLSSTNRSLDKLETREQAHSARRGLSMRSPNPIPRRGMDGRTGAEAKWSSEARKAALDKEIFILI